MKQNLWKTIFVWVFFALLGILGIIGWKILSVTPSFQTSNSPLTGQVILVDPGHGGIDGGAVSKDGLVEKEITLKIALFLRDYLQEAGAYVVLTREKDYDLANEKTDQISKRKAEDLMRRVHLIKEKYADAVISIHLNAFPQKQYSGAQTFYDPKLQANQRLASFIQRELIQNLENTKRIPKQKGDVYLLKESSVPTVLVEAGFLSNDQEAKLLATENYQKKIAASIYSGIIKYYSKEKEPHFPS